VHLGDSFGEHGRVVVSLPGRLVEVDESGRVSMDERGRLARHGQWSAIDRRGVSSPQLRDHLLHAVTVRPPSVCLAYPQRRLRLLEGIAEVGDHGGLWLAALPTARRRPHGGGRPVHVLGGAREQLHFTARACLRVIGDEPLLLLVALERVVFRAEAENLFAHRPERLVRLPASVGTLDERTK